MDIFRTVIDIRHFDKDLEWSALMKADAHTLCGWREVVRASGCPWAIPIAETLDGGESVWQIVNRYGDAHADQVGRDLIVCLTPGNFHSAFDWRRGSASVKLPGTLAVCREISLYDDLVSLQELIGHLDAVRADHVRGVWIDGLCDIEINELLWV